MAITKTILIAEDEQDLLSALSTTLTDAGYTVVAALDGEEALALFTSEQPDMVLLDIHMPKKSGIEVLNHIRQTEAGKAIPISIITASEELGAVSDVLEVGGIHTDFLTKTDFSLEQIKNHVATRLA